MQTSGGNEAANGGQSNDTLYVSFSFKWSVIINGLLQSTKLKENNCNYIIIIIIYNIAVRNFSRV